VPIHPSEIAAQKSERDFSRLCAAIDKHILDNEKCGPIRFRLHDDTEPSLVRRVIAAYADKGWSVNRVRSVDAHRQGDEFKATTATEYLEFSTREEALGVPMSAEEILDHATNKLTRIQWHLTRSSLLPARYEVTIQGEIVAEVGKENEASITVQVSQQADSGRGAALQAVAKLRQLVAFVPDIQVPSPVPDPLQSSDARLDVQAWANAYKDEATGRVFHAGVCTDPANTPKRCA
jgi:hypothetical protein